nr:immunoglobulin light chain junction region [Macaca mulatta]MPN93998.1 immunoglobulin light chain junction region [Macaca mulatta]MPN96235.1 immunoglobulin light chain junction region [Macaca mulatta]MPN97648.1 immunoglobulin light chain junction region [Macaca mulatta]MPN99205.1 immunoglobulin light chain junction region [Macaca mulatta]
CQHYYSIPSTF